MNKGVKIGIVLEGGGAKGAYQAGVLKALKELNLQYGCVVGTSIGALNAASYVIGDYKGCAKLWKDLDFSIKDSNNGSSTNSSLNVEKFKDDIGEFEKDYMKSNGVDSEPIVQVFKQIIDEDAIRKAPVELGITTYCLSDRKPLRLFKNDIPIGMMHEFIFASCNLPVFKPRPIEGKYYLDGSYFSKLPIEMAVEKECNVIITVRLRPEPYDYGKYKDVKIIDISPDEFLSSTLEASRERINWMIDEGYKDAIKILKSSVHAI